MKTKQQLLDLINTLPDDEKIGFECIVGDSFNFSKCKLEIIYNEDEDNYRLRMSATKDENLI